METWPLNSLAGTSRGDTYDTLGLTDLLYHLATMEYSYLLFECDIFPSASLIASSIVSFQAVILHLQIFQFR